MSKNATLVTRSSQFQGTRKIVGKKYAGVYGGPHDTCNVPGVHRHVPKGGRWS